jgi:hypothetical protein
MMSRKDVFGRYSQNSRCAHCGIIVAASRLEIDDFYDVLREEEAQRLLRETRGDNPKEPRLPEAA